MFGNNLKMLRVNANLTQQQLAEKLQVAPSTIGMYESNKRMPDAIALSTIANLFDVSIDFLLDRTNDSSPANDRIIKAVSHNPEQLEFTKELMQRESMQLLFKQVKPLSDNAINQIIDIIKVLEKSEDNHDK